MATVAALTRRWTTTQYHRLADAQILGPNDKTELVDGRIVYKLDYYPAAAAAFEETGQLPARAWTADEHRELVRWGILGPTDPVEIVDVAELPIMTQQAPHPTAVSLAADALRAIVGKGVLVREEKPLTPLDGWEPEPDVALVQGSARDFRRQHPTTALLVIEVADASLAEDRTIKARAYPAAEIEDYWIVNLPARQLEVHRGPVSERGYSDVRIFREFESVSPLAKPDAQIPVADLLP